MRCSVGFQTTFDCLSSPVFSQWAAYIIAQHPNNVDPPTILIAWRRSMKRAAAARLRKLLHLPRPAALPLRDLKGGDMVLGGAAGSMRNTDSSHIPFCYWLFAQLVAGYSEYRSSPALPAALAKWHLLKNAAAPFIHTDFPHWARSATKKTACGQIATGPAGR